MACSTWFVRFMVTLLHLGTSAAAGLCVVYSLLKYSSQEECLPSMVNVFNEQTATTTTTTTTTTSRTSPFRQQGKWKDQQEPNRLLLNESVDAVVPFQLTGESGLCVGLLGVLIAICILNLAMSAFVNFLWRSSCFLYFHLVISLCLGAVCVFGACLFTVYKMIWCQNIEEKVSGNDGCWDAAQSFDNQHSYSANMTASHDRIQMEMWGMWLLVPLTYVTVLFYAIALLLNRSKNPYTVVNPGINDQVDGNINNETSPLLN